MQAVMSPILIDANYAIDSISEDEDAPTSVGTASEQDLQKTELDILGEIDFDNLKGPKLPERLN